jgi:hypothetical protein
MIKMMRKAALGAATAGLVFAQPALASMDCWGRQEAAAAKVRNLQSRLMVATLRCRAMGYDKEAAYNGFVVANRSALTEANGLIKAQFDHGYGHDGATYYDRFATSLANQFGGDATDGGICDRMAAAAEEGAAAAGDVGKLVALAESFGPAPALPGGECTVKTSLAEIMADLPQR